MTRRIGFARWRSDLASGGNRYDEELATGLAAVGFDVREYPIAGPWPCPTDDDRQRLARTLTREQDWLIGNIVGSGAPAAITAAVAAGRRVTMLVHYFPADDPSLPPADREGLERAEAAAVRAATTIVVTSSWAAGEVRARYGRADAVVAVPGVAPADLAPGTGASPPLLLWLGRLTALKDPLTFIEALTRVRDLDWRAQLVGPDTVDERLSGEVRERIAAGGLASRVEVTGPRTGAALEATWADTALLVHTSRSETYGMVVSEALARGIPAIVPAGTGAVEAQGAGAAVPPGDAGALAGALRDWLTDHQLRQSWRATARDRRGDLPTWRSTAELVAAALGSARG